LTSRKVLAFDLGASSGRTVVGELDGEKLSAVDIYRFPNDPVCIHRHLYWDILRLLHEVKQGLITVRLQGIDNIQSIGIDTWGLDFGLLDSRGELLGAPYHYRDAHTDGMMEEIQQIIPRAELFARTGNQFKAVNTIYHLYAMEKSASPSLRHAQTLLMMPALLRYFLTSEVLCEWTITSTTQLCNPYTHLWDRDLIERLGLPTHIFIDPVAPGRLAGTLLPSVGEEVGLAPISVIMGAEHDTASAILAVPAEQPDFAFLSSGTWSLLGTEVPEPILSEQTLNWNISNEAGVSATMLFKSITGLWFIQECRRIWRNEGSGLSYGDERRLLEQAPPFHSFINPEDPMFINPPHMPRQIQRYCQETSQPVPETEGELLRCIIESQAMCYRFVLERIEQLVRKHFAGLYLVGGGVQHATFCQCIANALARPVWAGPQEAAAIGNVLMQYIVLGYIENIQRARQIVRNSFPITTYQPENTASWDKAYEAYCQVTQQQST
jgi:rhamnulokinase